jgi:hypothetical protein
VGPRAVLNAVVKKKIYPGIWGKGLKKAEIVVEREGNGERQWKEW